MCLSCCFGSDSLKTELLNSDLIAHLLLLRMTYTGPHTAHENALFLLFCIGKDNLIGHLQKDFRWRGTPSSLSAYCFFNFPSFIWFNFT